MWPDIKKISLFDDIPTSVTKLVRTMERFDASRFFAGHTSYSRNIGQEGLEWQLKEKSWLNWAAIVALPSASIDGPLHRDLSDIGIGDQWKDSEERKEIYTDPLLGVLFELRNYEVHVELRTTNIKDFHAYLRSGAQPDSEPRRIDYGDEVFLSNIDFHSFSKLRNIHSGHASITSETIDWFNRQTSTWPSSYLIGDARDRYAIYIAKYLKRNGIK